MRSEYVIFGEQLHRIAESYGATIGMANDEAQTPGGRQLFSEHDGCAAGGPFAFAEHNFGWNIYSNYRRDSCGFGQWRDRVAMFIYRLDDECEFLSSSSMAWGQDVQTDRSGRQQVNVRWLCNHLARAGTVLRHVKNTKPLAERRQGHLDARPAGTPVAVRKAESVSGRQRLCRDHAHVLPGHNAGHAPSRSGLGSGVSRLCRHEVLQHRPGLQASRRRLHDQGIALTQPLGAEGQSQFHALPGTHRRLRWRAIRRHNRVGTRSVRLQDYGVEGSPFVCIVLYRTHCRSTPWPCAATIRAGHN